jgi:O-acetyl-ADP-ribose deacetylase (regulator of RNase III)
MVGQHGLKRAGGKPPIRYEAVETALVKVAEEAKRLKATIHMPRIGCGLAGGTWEHIEPIIGRSICDMGIVVFVYDLE